MSNIDWKWPIEWIDGTPVIVAIDPTRYGPDEYYKLYSDRPSFWTPSMADPLKGLSASSDSAIVPGMRNVDITGVRFRGSGLAPSGGCFMSSTVMKLLHPMHASLAYSWPALQPKGHNYPVEIVSQRDIMSEEIKALELDEMQDNPLYGAF